MQANRSLLIGLLLLSLPLLAKLVPAPIFVDNMVLQREMSVPVWGTADVGELVEVAFAGQTVKAVADNSGKWMARLSPLTANAEGAELVIKGSAETITVKNVLVGEVWLCSGQSNMEMPMWTDNARWRNTDGNKFVAEGANPLIRFTKMVPYGWSKFPRTDFPMKWEALDTENGLSLSACAFFFGQELQRELKIPIGLVTSHWGGTRIEPWTPPCGFDSVPEVANIAHEVNAKLPGTKTYSEVADKTIQTYKEWLEKFQAAKDAGEELPKAPDFPGELVWSNSHQQSTVLYNKMLYPFVPFAFRGAIWYQGCSNLGDGMLYRHKMQALFNGWKVVFQNPDLKFYFVQLAPFNYGGDPERLPRLMEAQQAFADANGPAVGMAVINDVGDLGDIHPHDKQTVGKRLAALALKRDYGKDIKADSPTLASCEFVGGQAILTFKNAEGWKTTNDEAVKNFTLAGIDGVHREAKVKIDGAKLIVTADGVEKAKSVRYHWHQLNEGNLFNEAGFPLGAFRFGHEATIDEVKEYLAKDAQTLYEIDLRVPLADGKAKYIADKSADIRTAKRVTYFVESKTVDGDDKWIAVSMDAFSDNVKDFGLPLHAILAKRVFNLVVISNVPGIKCGEHKEGNIEFWPNNYGTGNKWGFPGASGNKYDFGDDVSDGEPKPGYGSMQVHLFGERQTLFAFNNFRSPTPDFGIGNSASEHPDWTFTSSSKNYSKIKMTVLVQQ
ncbi:MAG: 9-O-acetylesterase [Lentisphaerae bacterium]|jgi:sialate O-acetylesterase|nr:9-O-acetylesterase [Lentisphaerota bacterium]